MTKKFEGAVVATWRDASRVWIAMAVDEPKPHDRMEYNASVRLKERVDANGNPLPDFDDLSPDEQIALLIETVKAKRQKARSNDIQHITVGTTTIAL